MATRKRVAAELSALMTAVRAVCEPKMTAHPD
jgi:hypothetical protein